MPKRHSLVSISRRVIICDLGHRFQALPLPCDSPTCRLDEYDKRMLVWKKLCTYVSTQMLALSQAFMPRRFVRLICDLKNNHKEHATIVEDTYSSGNTQ